MEAAGIFTSPRSLPAGSLMMDRRAVKRAGLSQRKTDVSLQFSVSAVAIEITHPSRGEDVLGKTGAAARFLAPALVPQYRLHWPPQQSTVVPYISGLAVIVLGKKTLCI